MESRVKSLIVLFLVNYAGNSGYSLVIPLYPPLANNKGLSDDTIGYIFCLYPVGAFLFTLILGQNMSNKIMKMVINKYLFTKLMIFGLILEIIGMIGMALV